MKLTKLPPVFANRLTELNSCFNNCMCRLKVINLFFYGKTYTLDSYIGTNFAHHTKQKVGSRNTFKYQIVKFQINEGGKIKIVNSF